MSKPTEKRWESNGARHTAAPKKAPQALVDGGLVEIAQHLITNAHEGSQVDLPKMPPDDSFIRPVADELSDQSSNDQVASNLLAHPRTASILLGINMLEEARRVRWEEFQRKHGRLLERQRGLPSEIPASKSTTHPRNWVKEVGVFWFNWSGLAFASLSAWLAATVVTEVLYQVGGLRESSWGLVQSFFGAFGFCWGFTMAVVVVTYWRRKVMRNPDAHPLDQKMSRLAFAIAWSGLAGFGFLMGMMHSFEPGESRLLSLYRCGLTTGSVLCLGLLCVAIEIGAAHVFRSAYRWTLVRNDAVDAMDDEIHTVATQLGTLAQIEALVNGVKERIENHIRSQQIAWLRRRDEIRRENQTQRDVAAEEAKIMLSENRLAGLRTASRN